MWNRDSSTWAQTGIPFQWSWHRYGTVSMTTVTVGDSVGTLWSRSLRVCWRGNRMIMSLNTYSHTSTATHSLTPNPNFNTLSLYLHYCPTLTIMPYTACRVCFNLHRKTMALHQLLCIISSSIFIHPGYNFFITMSFNLCTCVCFLKLKKINFL